jgi:hypothetical protein
LGFFEGLSGRPPKVGGIKKFVTAKAMPFTG